MQALPGEPPTFVVLTPHRGDGMSHTSGADSTPETPLNRTQVALAWSALRHPDVKAVRGEIDKRLQAGAGIIVFRGHQPMNVKPAYDFVLHRDMMPLANNALDALLVLGVVPFVYRKSKSMGLGPENLQPYVPEPQTYEITVWTEKGRLRFSFYWGSMGGKRETNVVIWHNINANPLANGTLTSAMASVAPQLALATQLQTLMLKAERINANPDLVLGYNVAMHNAAQNATKQHSAYGNDTAAATVDSYVFERNAEQLASTKEFIRKYEAETGLSGEAAFGEIAKMCNDPISVYEDTQTGGGDAVEHRLRTTDMLVAQRHATPRSDYTQILEQIRSTVCRVMNVPEAVLKSSTNVRAGVQIAADSMDQSVRYYAEIISDMLTSIHNDMFFQHNLSAELRMRADRKRKSKFDYVEQLLTEEDLFESKRAVYTHLAFDLPPLADVETLHDLRNRGLISYKTYAEAVLRATGFPAEQLDSPDDPFTTDERKAMVLTKRIRRDTPSSKD